MEKRALLPHHGRYDYVPLTERRDYSWPGGKRLAFCVTTNIEWYAFGAGLRHDPGKVWWTRPRDIANFCHELPKGMIPGS